VSPAHAGLLLREWRTARRLSQLDLSLMAGTSARHLSCIETGKAQPSRDMIERFVRTLELPLRECNALLMAAGYAPKYPESDLGAPELAQVQQAIELILQHQEPFPAFLLNRHWDILKSNPAAQRVREILLQGRSGGHSNMIRTFFDPEGLRPAVVNWEDVASNFIGHLHDEVAAVPTDTVARALLDEVLSYPGVPDRLRTREPGAVPLPLLTVVFRVNDRELRFFSTFTRFGTPWNVTLDDLRIECTFPADEATKDFCRELQACAGRVAGVQ
jgi:transcriptional regulator with XRE-family HTH domain